jgi:hypothetical protein
MAGNALDITASLMCPHGGTVVIAGSNARVSANGLAFALASDTAVIAGCPFVLPGPKPSPCVRVQWIVADMRVTVNGAPTLSQSSVGICFSAENIPQGSVIIKSTQPRTSTQ